MVLVGHYASGQDHVGSGIISVAEHPVFAVDIDIDTDSDTSGRVDLASPLVWATEDPLLFAEAGDPKDPFYFPEVKIIKRKTANSEPRIYLGVALSPVSEALRSHLKLRKNSGVLVNHVIENSPASEAGILQYDVLTHLDDQLLLNQQQLVSLLATYDEGDNVTVHFFREGAQKTLVVSLQEKSLPPIETDLRKILPQGPYFSDFPAERIKADFGVDPSTPMKDVIEALEIIGNDTDVASVFVNPTGPGDKNVQANAKVRIQTAEGLSTTLSMLNGVRHITILDKDQNVLFEGPFDAETDLSSKVPSEYHRALKTIQQHNKEFFQRGTNAESMLKSLFQKKKSSDQKSSLSGGHSTSSSSSSSNSRSIQVNDGERTMSFNSKDGVSSLKVTKKEDGKDVVLYDGPANNAALGKIPFPHKTVVRKFLQDNGIISPSSK